MERVLLLLFFFFFNDTATTEIYTLSLHDALPIYAVDDVEVAIGVGVAHVARVQPALGVDRTRRRLRVIPVADRKSTRLNSSHLVISYAVFCLKKKKYTFTFNVNTSSMYLYSSSHN